MPPRTRATTIKRLGHAAMIGAAGPRARAARATRRAAARRRRRSRTGRGACASTRSTARRPRDRGRPGRLLPGLDVQRHGARPRDPRDRGRHPARAASSTAARIRTRSTSTASTPATWTASSRSWSRAARSRTSSPRGPYGMQLYHCHATPLKKHIHKGLYGAFIIDPPEPRAPAQELVMVMNGYDTDGDGENNFYTVNGLAFYYAKYPIRVSAVAAGPHLPRQPDRVRPDQLVPPARRLLPALPHRHDRPLRVHGHGHALPGRARDPRDRLRTTPAASCSTPTSRSSPSSAGWASSTVDRLMTAVAPRRALAAPLAPLALVPIVLLVGAVSRSRPGGSLVDLVGLEARRPRTSSTSAG